jgi:hypothetical protein
VFCGAGGLHGTLAFWQPLATIEQQADLIVVGAAGHGAQAGNGISFAIQVDRVVKGDASLVGTTVSVIWANPGQASSADVKGNGLWFLQSSTGG